VFDALPIVTNVFEKVGWLVVCVRRCVVRGEPLISRIRRFGAHVDTLAVIAPVDLDRT